MSYTGLKTLTGSPVDPPQEEKQPARESRLTLAPELDSWYCRVDCEEYRAHGHGNVPMVALLACRDRVLDLRAKRRLPYDIADAMTSILFLARKDLREQQIAALEFPTLADPETDFALVPLRAEDVAKAMAAPIPVLR